MAISRHYSTERAEREAVIRQIGDGEIIAEKQFNRGHKNGPEVYQVTTTGLIIVRNARTWRLVTKLIARPSQLDRWFGDELPNSVYMEAWRHQEMGYHLL